jgi:hypothetical protein
MPYDWNTGQYQAGPLGRTVPVDPAATAGLGHPSFLNSLYSNPFPKRRVGPTGRLVPTDPAATAGLGHPAWLNSLYPKAKTTTKKAGTPASTDPYDKWIKMIQGYFETPAQMEARVNREINAQIAAQKKVMDDEYAKQRADAMASFQAQSLAGAAAAAMSKDLFGAVGGEFNAAAGEMKGLAHGLSKNAAAATAGDVSAANAGLASLGNAPVTEGGTFGVGGGKQQGVEEYRGGTLAAQMFGTQGEAANFGLAGMLASQNLEATQTAQAALIKTERDINDSHSKAIDSLNAGRLDLYHQYMSDAKDSQIKYVSLLQGLVSAKAAQGVKVPTTRLFGNVYKQWDPTTGTWVPIDKKAAKPGSVKTFKGTDGRTYVLHPNGTATLVPGQSGPKPPTGQPYRFKGTNGVTYEVGADGVARPIAGQPGPKDKPQKGQLTELQIRNMVEFWHTGKPGKTGTVPYVIGYRKDNSPILANLQPGSKFKWAGGGKIKAGTTLTVPAGLGTTKGGTPASTYQQALKRLLSFGVDGPRAKAILDTYWRRGEAGRPYLDVFQRQALGKAGKQVYADRMTDSQFDAFLAQHPAAEDPANHISDAYLNPNQVAALQKANLLPPGFWVNSGTRGIFGKGGARFDRVYVLYEGFE